ncbi:Phr family secreted Rap phosphatase inhibitor [Bacillus pseudomycoides]|uniref:Phr family secreted Rap phosphatase inhibitor n=1 Tax=Bacillus pseudomycoides TaxID=64104 RepID=UPI000BED8896|nr:Phr family secreted Rap phosphatase inhibitor [Bacillus pseudomycoides]PEB40789.1 Phr family secreted Rap phosphatase inhibitor [Bacillus pseudomycoides]PEM36927.1 Phr family secreted Rap phosphatase inhibitor [Bacillus pseudomycoides]PGD94121.1 Phr family secreted Rap phosphatase inhibitor [Bacillus pseudomycoides]PGE05158.1 Phr family secreted Rap phosphatase inhibitor [Bacillus pseudomycoides]PHE68351.1 Phr family secreted Rap phosphatase inhibitor [Bacillus pseudomycoides]
MIKKVTTAVTGLALIGIVSIGLGSSFTYQAGHADLPAPANPDYVNVGDGGAPSNEHGDYPAPKEL